jgi:hypothetical protein
MVKASAFKEVGGFDERFFMYGEDIDLSYRIQKAGFTNFYFAETCIIHFKGESTKKASVNYVKMFYKAMSVFANKHYGGTKAGLFNFFIQIGIFFRAGLSATARLFNRDKPRVPGFNDELARAIIVGTRRDFSEVSVLFQTCGIKKLAVGNILEEELVEPETKSFLNRVADILSAKNANEIIFCEGQLSFKKIISILPYIPKHIVIIFFTAYLHSLISSSDKNEAGIFILKKNK